MTDTKTMVRGHVQKQLFWMTLPMIAGIFFLSAFQLIDAYFVSQLGVQALAAMSFTFPVVMVVGAIALGMGIGASAVVSRTMGRGETHRVRVLVRDSLLMAVIAVALASVGGVLTIDPLFRLLGASEELLPMIRQYMVVWYSGAFLLSLTMVSNHCLRATGDIFATGMLMIFISALNAVLDPLLILGWGGFPALGMQGAAVAAVISRLVTVMICLYILIARCRIVECSLPRWGELMTSWREIIKTAAPSSATGIMNPLVAGLVTWMVARYGTEAVAAVGAGARVLQFTYIIPVALGTVLVPFIGQNWGAGEIARAGNALRTSYRFSLYYSAVCFLLYLPFAQQVGGLFSHDARVIWILGAYVTIMQALSCFTHVGVHSEFAMNAMGFPLQALVLNILRTLLFNAGFALAGQWLFGMWGIFFGQATGNVVAGVVARCWAERFIQRQLAQKAATGGSAGTRDAGVASLASAPAAIQEQNPEGGI